MCIRPSLFFSLDRETKPPTLSNIINHQVCDKGWMALLGPGPHTRSLTMQVLDSDLSRRREYVFSEDVTPELSEGNIIGFDWVMEAGRMMIYTKAVIRVYDLNGQTERPVVRIPFRAGSFVNMYESPGAALCPDGSMVFCVAQVAPGIHFLQCWNVDSGTLVCESPSMVDLDCHFTVEIENKHSWPLNGSDLILRIFAGAGQDGTFHETFIFEDGSLHMLPDDGNYAVLDAVASALYDDGAGCFTFNEDLFDDSGEELDLENDDETAFAYQAVAVDRAETQGLVLTNAARVWKVDMSDPAELVGLVDFRFPYRPTYQTKLCRGSLGRLITMEPDGRMFLWKEDYLLSETYYAMKWSPSSHMLFPAAIRKRIETAFLCLRQLHIPKDVILVILKCLGLIDF